MRTCVVMIVFAAITLATPASAGWRAANSQVTEAAKNPRIAAVLAATERMDKAILAHDVAAFSAIFTDDAVVNNPFNKIARKNDAIANLRTGLIDYATLERSIEYAALRGDHDVVLMGMETLKPVGKARFAGTTIRRRTTEIWTDDGGIWKLAVRQATIYAAE